MFPHRMRERRKVAEANRDGGPLRVDLRSEKAYTIGQAARLAGISAATARRWLAAIGRDHAEVRDPDLLLSFFELIELVVFARFRAQPNPVKVERIARAHAFAGTEFGTLHPFASLKLLQLGGHVLHHFDIETAVHVADWIALDMAGHPTLPGLVQSELDRNVDYRDGFAGVWHPRGRGVPIIVDPYIAGGRPVLEGHGITIETMQRRWAAGESFDELAVDYDLSRAAIERAVQAVSRAA
ncbi:MAG: DUF433 domain-containing protein [Chloroflexota bacterium]|nr:MAG: DUF433 domain-containing protein [Chloroflexota bacterium]